MSEAQGSQKGFSVVVILIALIVVGAVGFASQHILKQRDSHTASLARQTERKSTQQSNLSPQAQAESRLQKEQASLVQLEPVSAGEFGDYGAVAANASPQRPSEPAKVGNKVSTNMYQGIVFQDADKNRILVGKLRDKSTGSLELSDVFELVTAGSATSLRMAQPNVVAIDTTKVIKWANLPDNNQMVKALLKFKMSNP